MRLGCCLSILVGGNPLACVMFFPVSGGLSLSVLYIQLGLLLFQDTKSDPLHSCFCLLFLYLDVKVYRVSLSLLVLALLSSD